MNTRSHFESLSTAELISLADDYGIDIPHDLERIFIIEELLETLNANAVNQKTEDEITINPSYAETAELPKQYNISYIDIVIRDPLWVFAFWEVKEQDKESYEKSPDFKGYFLRIIPLNEDGTASITKDNFFTIPVDIDDNARYIGFTELSASDSEYHSSLMSGRFILKLGALNNDEEHQIALSQPFRLPRLITNDDIIKMSKNPLAVLSGIAELSVIIDRQKFLVFREQ